MEKTMNINVRSASLKEKDLMQNLLQLYIYDFTEFTDADINCNGLYNIMPDFESYWLEHSDYLPFLIHQNNNIAGFALVKISTADTRRTNSLAHFFILRKYRRLGIGKQAARLLFDSLKGEWELYQLDRNLPAQKFWTNMLSEYTTGNYTERHVEGRKYQTFYSE